jgi:hypothetical protein
MLLKLPFSDVNVNEVLNGVLKAFIGYVTFQVI